MLRAIFVDAYNVKHAAAPLDASALDATDMVHTTPACPSNARKGGADLSAHARAARGWAQRVAHGACRAAQNGYVRHSIDASIFTLLNDGERFPPGVVCLAPRRGAPCWPCAPRAF